MDEQPPVPTNDVQPATAPAASTPPTPPQPTTPAPMPTAAPAAAPALSGTPDTWPGAFGTYKYSKQAVKLNLGAVILLLVIYYVVSLVMELVLKQIGQIIAVLIGTLMTTALTLVYLAGVRGQRKSFGQALSEALPLWLKMIGLFILIALSIVASAVLFIIPVFFVLPRLALAYYFLIDKHMGVIEAYKASWHATKGNAGKVWGIIGATILMALLMITIIGIPFSIYFLIMYSAVFAVLYEFLGKTQPTAPAAPAPAAVPAAPAAAPPVVQ